MLRTKRQLWILGIALFLTYISMMVVYTMLPLYVKFLGGSKMGVGITMGAGCIGYFIGAPFWGWISDKTGKRIIYILLGPCGFALMAVALMASKTANQVCLSHLIGAFVASAEHPVLMAYIGDVAPREAKGRWMGTMGGLSTLGMAIGAFIAGATMTKGYGVTCYLVLGMNMIAMCLITVVIWRGEKAEALSKEGK